MLRTSRAQPDWEHEGESALVAASSKAQIKCVNELIKAGAEVNQRDSNGKKKSTEAQFGLQKFYVAKLKSF